MSRLILTAICLCCASPALAQSPTPGGMPPPPGMSLQDSAAMRFPQPVRVGDLIGRDVRRPVRSQQSLGQVRDVVRRADGQIAMVIRYGGRLGIGGRLIAVPVDAMVLLGDVVEPVAFSPAQLDQFPTFQALGTQPVSHDAEIKVGLAKPSH